MESAAQWIEAHALPCPTKAWLHVECPGCGFQRGFAALMRFDVAGVWEHYPPLFFFVLTFLLLAFALVSRHPIRLPLLKGAFFATLGVVGLNYAFKIIWHTP